MKEIGKEIYILDDSLEFCKIMVYSLEKSGIVVRSFTRSETFYKACRARLPTLCMVDLNISKALDGFEVVSSVRTEISKELPIIIVSNQSDDHAVIHALELGANDYIFKPVEKIMLLSKLSAYMDLDDDSAYKNLKLPSLADLKSNVLLGTAIELHTLDEFGVWFYADNLISRGTVSSIESSLLNQIIDLAPSTKIELTITSCKANSNDNYLYYGEFSTTKTEYTSAIRLWLKSHTTPHGP